MLPKNNLRKMYMKRLLIFPDETHPYANNILKKHDVEYEKLVAEARSSESQEV